MGASIGNRFSRRTVLGFLGAFLGVIGSITGIYAFIESKVESSRPPPPMSGNLNIAVARFSAFDDRGRQAPSQSADALADQAFRSLKRQLNQLEEAGFQIQVRAPRHTGVVDEWSAEQRKQRLIDISDATNADIVLTAKIISSAGRSTITPELYVAGAKLHGAPELEGYHQLGEESIRGDINSNMVTEQKLRDELLAQVQGTTQFIVGLGFYYERQYDEAIREFGIAEPYFNNTIGRKLLYLFLGNAAGKQNKLPAASRYYRYALSIDPSYGRARLGLAELTFQQARGSCERSNVDVSGLKIAAKMYRNVLREGSPGGDLPVKVALGLGRVYVCLSQAEVINGWAEARAQLTKVVEQYVRGNEHIQEFASEAHAALGFTYLPPEGAKHAEGQYRQAADEYKEAIRLSLDEQRQGVLYGYLAFAYAGLNDLPKACQAYERAAGLDPDHATQYRKERRALRECVA